MITRNLQKSLKDDLFKGKVVIIYGARQVGKTTLTQYIQQESGISDQETKYIDCDLIRDRQDLGSQDLQILQELVGNAKLVCIDEAQRVKNIGLSLKIIHHYMPSVQLIVTGSSSFDIASDIKEPLTGRSLEYILPPLSIEEVLIHYDKRTIRNSLERIIQYGLYPQVFLEAIAHPSDAKKTLKSIAENYLYKDILSFDIIKKEDILYKLIKLLALQIGSEISYSELANNLGLDKKTIQKYIDLLEKSFVIFQLWGYSRNLRKEITRSPKIYFRDVGIRNALIDDFRPLEMRPDIGGLWENFIIAERKKKSLYTSHHRLFFWREYSGQEIDLLEIDEQGNIDAFEIKYNKTVHTPPSNFIKYEKLHSFNTINNTNFLDYM